MEVQLGFLMFGALTGAAAYLLYCRGIAVTKGVAALLFVFRTGKDGDRAALDSCTGWVRHMGRFRRSGTYVFSLDCRLVKGRCVGIIIGSGEEGIAPSKSGQDLRQHLPSPGMQI